MTINIETLFINKSHSDDFIEKYKETLYAIMVPLSRQTSKVNCDKLLYLYMKINKLYNDPYNLQEILNPLETNTDIFNSEFKIPPIFIHNISKYFKESKIQSATKDLYKIFYDLMNYINTNNLSYLCVSGRPTIESYPTGNKYNSIYPLYIHSNINKNDLNEKRLLESKKFWYKKYNENIKGCIEDKKLVIGFIDIFTQYRRLSIDHKNSIIIDSVNKIIIRFEPKSKSYVLDKVLGVMSFMVKPSRYPMNSDVIKERLKEIIGEKIDEFSIIIIYGGQSTISLNHDWEYCVLYSLYACLLFSKNSKIISEFKHNYKLIRNNSNIHSGISNNSFYINSVVEQRKLNESIQNYVGVKNAEGKKPKNQKIKKSKKKLKNKNQKKKLKNIKQKLKTKNQKKTKNKKT